ncbi:MAG: ATP-binding protein [Lachnospiraceae bacterium]|nr:ATP-binding protein [Lachnospiraceae bacterium]
MIQERSVEYEYLRNFYQREENQIVILYGDRYSGLSEFIRDFLKGMDYFYYYARPCSDEEQLLEWKNELRDELPKGTEFGNGYLGILSAMLNQKCEKRIIIIDEFQNIAKTSADFIETLIRVSGDKWNNQPALFLLLTRSSYWIENQMVERLGKSAYEISGLIRLNELKFLDIVRHFKKYELKECVEIYSILGGCRELWDRFDDELTVSENISKNILTKGTPLYEYGMDILPEELREPSVYNTILAALSNGREKLNDIYKYTGFSRAKISVYLKNLIALGIVKKVDSYDTACRENAQKGIYRIANSFTGFWFRFVFTRLSKLNMMHPDRFYQKYIAPSFKAYSSRYFTEVCSEYLELMNRMGKLSFKYTKKGSWIGKVGNIDIIAQDEEGNTLCALCSYEKSRISYEDYEWFLFCIEQAKLKVKDLFLFSAGDFDEQIIMEAEENENLYLIDSSKL